MKIPERLPESTASKTTWRIAFAGFLIYGFYALFSILSVPILLLGADTLSGVAFVIGFPILLISVLYTSGKIILQLYTEEFVPTHQIFYRLGSTGFFCALSVFLLPIGIYHAIVIIYYYKSILNN